MRRWEGEEKMKWRKVRRGKMRNYRMKIGGVVTVLNDGKKPASTFRSIRVTRNVQQWTMKVHQCQLSFILITNIPHF